MPLKDFHLGMKAFGNAVVTRKPPHSGDLLRPGSEGIAERNELRQLGLAELIDSAQEARGELGALLARPMLFQKQIAKPLLAFVPVE